MRPSFRNSSFAGLLRRRALLSLSAILLCAAFLQGATITDRQGIKYTVNEQSKTCTVSKENAGNTHVANKQAVVVPEYAQNAADGDAAVKYRVTDFETGAFKGAGFTKVTVEAPVASIPANCFQGCASLAEVVLPSSVKTLGDYAFQGCSSLKFPALADGITIGKYAFADCTSLATNPGEKVALPTGAKIGQYAFSGAAIRELVFPDDASTLSMGEYVFSKVTLLKEVTVPATLQSLPSYCFYACNSIEKADLSAAPKDFTIGGYAFSSCKNLTEAIFPEEIKSIGDHAFLFSGLQGINRIPKMESLGEYAFYGCKFSEITKEKWPDTPIGNIETMAFYSNKNLTKLELPDWMTEIPSSLAGSCNIEILKISPNTTKIGNWAFTENKIAQIELPETVTVIGSEAFSKNQLTSLNIPASVKEIGYDAFSYNLLTEITFPEPDNENFQGPQFGKWVFRSNLIESFTAPAWLKDVPYGFLQENKLKSLTLAPATRTIGERAFLENYKLINLELPETITKLDKNCFYKCGKYYENDEVNYLCSVVIRKGLEIADNAFEQAKIKEVSFEDCDYTIGNNIFKDVTSVKKISFPNCMTEIPAGICNGWSKLTEVVWPSDLRAIGKEAFKGCTALKVWSDAEEGAPAENTLDMTRYPFENVVDFGDFAFANTNISKIIWPETPVKTVDGQEMNVIVGEGLFSGLKSLTSAEIPQWMDEVPASLYSDCSNLTAIDWGNSERESIIIGSRALNGTAISPITWPDVPTTIGQEAFANNKTATEIVFPASPATLGNGSFKDCSNVTSPTELPDYITNVPSECFSGCSSLPSITLHEGITEVGKAAFYSCKALKHVLVEGDIKRIPDQCFMSCKSLETFEAKGAISIIAYQSFYGCNNLAIFKTGNIEKGIFLGSIGQNAFSFCESLEYFPDIMNSSTWNLGIYAFDKCSKLKTITIPCTFEYTAYSSYHKSLQFLRATSLQSVRFMDRNGKTLGLVEDVFRIDTPLLGVSYVMPDDVDYKYTVGTKTYNTIQPQGREKKGILMVNRGQKYRLMEKGWGNLWNIMERRGHKPVVYGDISSSFEVGDVRNHYTTLLRWDVVESDLNPSGVTRMTLRRGETVAARFEIQPCEYVTSITDEGNINADNVSANRYRIIIKERNGVAVNEPMVYSAPDMLYEAKENQFNLVTGYQHGSLYYDAASSHRIGINERLGDESWFIYKDEFDSPALDGSEGMVPDRYTYTLTIDGYDYEEPVNNDDYLVGEDGYAYHMEKRTLPTMTSEPCTVYASMAVPSLEADGYYTLEQIQADTDGSLPLSVDAIKSGEGNKRLAYSFPDEAQLKHKLYDTTDGSSKYIISKLTYYNVPDNGGEPEQWGTPQAINGNKGPGVKDVPADQAQPGKRFQLITTTNGRGTFGSRIVAVPDAHALEISAAPVSSLGATPEHDHHMIGSAMLTISPKDMQKLGYDDDCGTNMTGAQHRIGVWRKLSDSDLFTEDFPATYADNQADEELIHHLGELHKEHNWACGTCDANHTYDGEGRVFTDIFPMPENYNDRQYDADYRVRLYAQAANDPSKWMIAEANTQTGGTVLGVEDVLADPSGNVEYYNLQGLRVEQPREGEVVIRVDNRGSQKVVFTK